MTSRKPPHGDGYPGSIYLASGSRVCRAPIVVRCARDDKGVTLIPVTTFAGQRVALFGLGSSGLFAARALKDGGANAIAFDDDAQKIAEARAAGIKTQDLRNLDWGKTAALVLAPGVPLTHPQPHWTVGL